MQRKGLERKPRRDLETGPQTKGRAKAAKWAGVWQVHDHLARCCVQGKNRREGAQKQSWGQIREPFPLQWGVCIYHKSGRPSHSLMSTSY